MIKIEFLKISNPADFWIVEKNSQDFLNLIHEKIQKEKDLDLDRYLDSDCRRGKSIVCVFNHECKKWFRARIVEETSTFKHSECFTCFLIDTGDNLTVPKSNCKPLINQKLKDIPALARHCSLYGIKPRFTFCD